jgi:hypothetical protein
MLAVRTMPVTRSWSLREDALVAGIADTTYRGAEPFEHDLVTRTVAGPIAEKISAINLKVGRAEESD